VETDKMHLTILYAPFPPIGKHSKFSHSKWKRTSQSSSYQP